MTLLLVLAVFAFASVAHAAALVVMGITVAADVAVIGLFVGPALLTTSVGGWPIRLNLLPLGAYVRFQEEPAPAHLATMLLAANGVVLVIAGALLGIGDAARTAWGVWRWAITGGLFANASDADAVFQHVAATLEAANFASATGMVTAACVAINLLPIPMMNGGDAIVHFYRAVRHISESTREKILLTGFVVVLMLLVSWGYRLGKYVLTD